jgi:hypothetical protein
MVSSRRIWSGRDQQRPHTRDGQHERRELPVSNPAELAAYHDTTDTVDEADAAFVDLGYSDDLEGGFAPPVDGDEFGSNGDDGQVALDAA